MVAVEIDQYDYTGKLLGSHHYEGAPSGVTAKPANGSGLGLGCFTPTPPVELHLKGGRPPFDVNSVYLKTGKRFRVVLKYRTDLYLITGQICT
jgi:hypothetical protein